MNKKITIIVAVILAFSTITKAQTDTTIVGTINAATTKTVFSKIKNNKAQITITNLGLATLQMCLNNTSTACLSTIGVTVAPGQSVSQTVEQLGGTASGALLNVTNTASVLGNQAGAFLMTILGLQLPDGTQPQVTCNNVTSGWVSDGLNKTIFICPKNTKVGIGLEKPTQQLHLLSSGGSGGGMLIDYVSGSLFNYAALINVNDDNVSAFAITNKLSAKKGPNDELFSIKGNGNTFTEGNVYVGTKGAAVGYADGVRFAVNGKIKAREVVVEATGWGWPDFVFEKEYKLRSLKELETYINENKHLPEIPAASEVEEHGVSMAKMVTAQMQKIEEITLYLIEQNKKIEANQAEIEKLKAEHK